MDWAKIVADLVASGMTITEIAEACGVKQPSMSAIASGKTKEPIWRVAQMLLALHAKHCRPEKAAA